MVSKFNLLFVLIVFALIISIPIISAGGLDITKSKQEIMTLLSRFEDKKAITPSDIKININQSKNMILSSNHTIVEFEEEGKTKTLVMSNEEFKKRFM